MFFLIFLLLFTEVTLCSQIGSSLFYKRLTSDCWSEEDIAKLRTRKTLEGIIPPPVTPDKVNDLYVIETLRHFRNAFKAVEVNVNKDSEILKEVLADTIGAHLRSEILPAARFAYYAGYVSYRKVRELHNFFDQLKIFLNTQGLGWKRPSRVPEMANFTVEKILIGPDIFDPCARLVTKRDSKSCIHLPIPVADDHFQPTAMALPFKSGGLISLVSPLSENMLLKYYTTASKCILRNSPETCRHTDFVSFNNDLWHWMKKDVAPRLVDEKLYAAYGGILRVAAAVQSYGKGLHRRNLFDYQDSGVTKWHPWKALKESYVYINTDWTPHLYVTVILLLGFTICLLQICYSYICGDDIDCPCKRSNGSSISEAVAYARVDSNIPAILPSHSAVYYADQTLERKSTMKTKTSSLGSIKTQKVYDMHENTEKLMDVIMSDSDDSSEDSPPLSKRSQSKSDNVIDVGHLQRSKSPPKIETPITQIKVDKKTYNARPDVPMFSNSTVTNSEQTYQGMQATDSWSGTGCSSSDQTTSSRSSKSRCRRSRHSRDLAWARRVVSKHINNAKSTTGTELDVNSYATPLSNR